MRAFARVFFETGDHGMGRHFTNSVIFLLTAAVALIASGGEPLAGQSPSAARQNSWTISPL
jgi:hypothetical protein